MYRKLKPIAANIGGVEIVVTPQARCRVRRAARSAAVIGGYTAGFAAVTMAGVAVAQSVLFLPIVGCAAVAGSVAWRCIRIEKNRKESKREESKT